jgi:hypothetical protein
MIAAASLGHLIISGMIFTSAEPVLFIDLWKVLFDTLNRSDMDLMLSRLPAIVYVSRFFILERAVTKFSKHFVNASKHN